MNKLRELLSKIPLNVTMGASNDVNSSESSCKNGASRVTKGATLYYIKLILPNAKILYKIGYTTGTVNGRIHGVLRKVSTKTGQKWVKRYGMGVPAGTIVKIIATQAYNNWEMCFNDEQYLHAMHKSARYMGEKLLKNGNSELYVKDVLELDS